MTKTIETMPKSQLLFDAASASRQSALVASTRATRLCSVFHRGRHAAMCLPRPHVFSVKCAISPGRKMVSLKGEEGRVTCCARSESEIGRRKLEHVIHFSGCFSSLLVNTLHFQHILLKTVYCCFAGLVSFLQVGRPPSIKLRPLSQSDSYQDLTKRGTCGGLSKTLGGLTPQWSS